MNLLISELLDKTETILDNLQPTIEKEIYQNRRYILDPKNELLKKQEIEKFGIRLIGKIIILIKRVYLDREILKSIFFDGFPQEQPLQLKMIQKADSAELNLLSGVWILTFNLGEVKKKLFINHLR